MNLEINHSRFYEESFVKQEQVYLIIINGANSDNEK